MLMNIQLFRWGKHFNSRTAMLNMVGLAYICSKSSLRFSSGAVDLFFGRRNTGRMHLKLKSYQWLKVRLESVCGKPYCCLQMCSLDIFMKKKMVLWKTAQFGSWRNISHPHFAGPFIKLYLISSIWREPRIPLRASHKTAASLKLHPFQFLGLQTFYYSQSSIDTLRAELFPSKTSLWRVWHYKVNWLCLVF